MKVYIWDGCSMTLKEDEEMKFQEIEMDPRVFAVLQMAPRWMLTGSRAIVTPLPPGRDMDFIVEAPQTSVKVEQQFFQMLEANGFRNAPPDDGGSTDPETHDPETQRWVLDGPEYKTDLIVISNPHVYDRWVTATHVAKMLNVQERKHRVALFRAIRTGKWYDPEKPDTWPKAHTPSDFMAKASLGVAQLGGAPTFFGLELAAANVKPLSPGDFTFQQNYISYDEGAVS